MSDGHHPRMNYSRKKNIDLKLNSSLLDFGIFVKTLKSVLKPKPKTGSIYYKKYDNELF